MGTSMKVNGAKIRNMDLEILKDQTAFPIQANMILTKPTVMAN